MNELDYVLKIAEIVLFVVLSISGIYLIISLRKIAQAVDKIEHTTTELTAMTNQLVERVDPVLQNALVVTDNVKEISTGVREQMVKVDSIVSSFKERADSLIDFEKKAQNEFETQIWDSLNFVSAIATGVKTFWGTLSSGKDRSNGRSRRRHRAELEDQSEHDY